MRFTLPRDSYHGKGALEVLKTLAGEKVIVTAGGGFMKRFGFLDKVVNHLKEAGTEVQLFEGVEPDPSVDTVLKGTAAMQGFEPDWIVAVGGGSPIGTTKATWAFYECPNTSLEDLITPFSFPTFYTKVKFCAISPILRTAAEVTVLSVITDYKKDIKYPLADFNATPGVAIMNPVLAETMPRRLTAHTGMDVMTHIIEAYVSALHCGHADSLTFHVIRMISEYLVPSYNGDMEAHDRMHDAQCLAGMAFSNALLGIVHSIAYRTGAAYFDGRIVHGCVNAMYLPKVIKFNPKESEAAARYAKVAKFINLPDTMDEELTSALVTRLLEMNKALGILAHIKDYEGGIIGEKEFMDKLPKVVELAVGDACTGSNLGAIIPKVMEQLLKCCYYDEEIDF